MAQYSLISVSDKEKYKCNHVFGKTFTVTAVLTDWSCSCVWCETPHVIWSEPLLESHTVNRIFEVSQQHSFFPTSSCQLSSSFLLLASPSSFCLSQAHPLVTGVSSDLPSTLSSESFWGNEQANYQCEKVGASVNASLFNFAFAWKTFYI